MEAEKNRAFCVHDMQHFLDVARLAYIFKLERGYTVSKEHIYAAAFLHDIGKWMQYEQGIPHEFASSGISRQILADAGFDEDERESISMAIAHHRYGIGSSELDELLYDADKISRNCYLCPVQQDCNWSNERKNRKVSW